MDKIPDGYDGLILEIPSTVRYWWVALSRVPGDPDCIPMYNINSDECTRVGPSTYKVPTKGFRYFKLRNSWEARWLD